MLGMCSFDLFLVLLGEDAQQSGLRLTRELLLQLPQALPGGLHVPQELGYFIVLGFGQLHASHRLTPRRRAWAAAGGAKGASDAAPVPGTAEIGRAHV